MAAGLDYMGSIIISYFHMRWSRPLTFIKRLTEKSQSSLDCGFFGRREWLWLQANFLKPTNSDKIVNMTRNSFS